MDKNEQIIDTFLEEKSATEPTPSLAQTEDVAIDTFLSEKEVTPPPTIVQQQSPPSQEQNTTEEESVSPSVGIPVISPPSSLTGMIESTNQQTNKLFDWMSSQPTPGGIGLLLTAIIFFLWIIVPIDATGKTRIQLLWGVMTGGYQIDPSLENTSGAGTNFGSGGIPSESNPQEATTFIPISIVPFASEDNFLG